MADFCKQCSVENFGEAFSDMEGLLTDHQERLGFMATVLCEGCGPIQVNRKGECCSSDCGKNHAVLGGSEWFRKFPPNSLMTHVKKGDVYLVVAYSLQESDPNIVLCTYKSLETDVPWTRPVSEILDGRFAPDPRT
jgi:hypothetical protein